MKKEEKTIIILTFDLSWNDAIDYASMKGMLIPNLNEAKELKLKGYWTSTTGGGFSETNNCSMAHILGEHKPIDKTELRPVAMIKQESKPIEPSITDKKGFVEPTFNDVLDAFYVFLYNHL